MLKNAERLGQKESEFTTQNPTAWGVALGALLTPSFLDDGQTAETIRSLGGGMTEETRYARRGAGGLEHVGGWRVSQSLTDSVEAMIARMVSADPARAKALKLDGADEIAGAATGFQAAIVAFSQAVAKMPTGAGAPPGGAPAPRNAPTPLGR